MSRLWQKDAYFEQIRNEFERHIHARYVRLDIGNG